MLKNWFGYDKKCTIFHNNFFNIFYDLNNIYVIKRRIYLTCSERSNDEMSYNVDHLPKMVHSLSHSLYVHELTFIELPCILLI